MRAEKKNLSGANECFPQPGNRADVDSVDDDTDDDDNVDNNVDNIESAENINDDIYIIYIYMYIYICIYINNPQTTNRTFHFFILQKFKIVCSKITKYRTIIITNVKHPNTHFSF